MLGICVRSEMDRSVHPCPSFQVVLLGLCLGNARRYNMFIIESGR